MLVQYHEILDVAFCFNNGQGKHRCRDTDADGVKTIRTFLAEVNYVPKNYKADKEIHTDMIPSHAQRVFEWRPLSQGHCFRHWVNEGKTHDR